MTARYLVLSHPLRPGAPVWPGNPPAAITELQGSIERGHESNSTRLSLFSHSGTHVDTPWHFDGHGPAAWQLPIDRFVFVAPRLLRVPKPEGGFITVDDLEPHATSLVSADIALLLTGWGQYRGNDPERYVQRGPLLHPDAARWLMDRYPGLRAIATDAVSIGSPAFPTETVETHRVLLGAGRDDGRFVLAYEDVALDDRADAAVRIYAWPLFIEGADGSPCTIVAELAPGR
jgi:arylformamidase